MEESLLRKRWASDRRYRQISFAYSKGNGRNLTIKASANASPVQSYCYADLFTTRVKGIGRSAELLLHFFLPETAENQ
ncbi:hypothetical protein [Paenibacillus sp. BIHB 4019]|uniref:hypothetical protein n=1 Tax=Paenibacillus sp. BIHB 4019 TaxID=1870819 RepID=UPI001237592D|nr:hypothetical protein [Paenibacillus sp. BIHB 4019]